VRGKFSKPIQVLSGVSQGILGPLLFLVYINDMPQEVASSIVLFADDAYLYSPITSSENSKQLQRDLDKLCSSMGEKMVNAVPL